MIGFVYERLYDDDGCVMPYSEDSFNMIRCPYGNVQVWVQEKYKITGLTEKSGDTTNIGSITRNSIDDFANVMIIGEILRRIQRIEQLKNILYGRKKIAN